MTGEGRSLRVVFHAINGVGLGHLARATALAGAVREIEPGASVVVVTNAADTSMLERAGLDFVQLPARLAEPHASPGRALRALPEPLHQRAFEAVLEALSPDVVVFDTHAPKRVVAFAARLGARPVLVLRELRPEHLSAFLRSPEALAFDAIVMPHEPGEIDPSALPAYPEVALAGPVVRAMPSGTGSTRNHAAPRLLVLAGGGGQPVDAARFLRAAADAHWLARARIDGLATTVVTGPYGEPPPGYPGLTVVRSEPDLPARMAEADLIVSQAGYNAVAEIRALAAPSVLVPGTRRMEDQGERARRLARLGAAALARPEARSIADAIERLLSERSRLEAMREAHQSWPFVPRNREVARALLSPAPRAGGAVRRVALVAHDFPPRVGGMETMAACLASALAERGLEVTVLSTDRLGEVAVPGLDRVRVERPFLPRGPRGQIDGWNDLLLAIGELARRQPDVIHLANGGLAPWAPLLSAALGRPVTVSVHGNDVKSPWVLSGVDAETYALAMADGLARASGVVGVSRFSADIARSLGAPGDRVSIVPNGVDPQVFSPEGEVFRVPGVGDDDPVVLTVARLAARKGHATVVRALPELARRFPRVRYAFTGASGSRADELLSLARSLGVGDRVVPLGIIPAHALPSLYRRASAFALVPDDNDDDVEGFGIALLEAAASGVPVVGSRSGGVPEALADGETGLLVPPGNAPALAEALGRLLGDPSLARRMGEAGRARAVAGFSWAHAAAGYLEAFESASRRPLPAMGEACRALLAEGGEGGEAPELDQARAALAGAATGAELARLGRERSARERLAREKAAERFREAAARGRRTRLRATREGAHLLPRALADCEAAGVRPEAELRLRSWLDEGFVRAVSPRVSGVYLVHVSPSPDAALLSERARALPASAVAQVRSVRLYVDDEAKIDPARAAAAAPEVHALREAFASRGVTVVPPPELMRYLSLTPAQRPETAMIEPTNHCNLACPTCPTGTGKIRPLPDMPPERFSRVLDGLGPQLRNVALWNYGEPTLHKKLAQLIGLAKEKGVGVVKVSSNAHFLDGERGRALLSSGLDVLIVSVDGASAETYRVFRQEGDFDRVARQIRWLCDEKRRLGLEKPRIELQFIVMRHNEHEIGRIRELAAEWGVDRLRVKTVGVDDEANRGLVPASQLLSRYREDGSTPKVRHPLCTNPWDHTVINVDGSVTPCCYLRPDMGDRFVMGNVFEAPFLEIWRGERYQAFRRAMLEGRASMPVCSTCRGGTHDLVSSNEEVRSP